ncbi:TIGR04282 family arsenosugar biosynthesis glycosyltransferase [Limisalsivibrio acetivorans]|uniref:TIGR04282 family arsenosugar biosynthesis glycosyltransferase n=1 Tax=Limisalsivibrio acetivorans TaxID=1304888 RepID=UPI0003B7358A|nr:TIGR04282 family arsenosugar biosynthesis glycosyltransferase [Limisalsivibrio acetivorans]
MKEAVCVFVKNPVPGKVKTRLAEGVGNEKAAGIYRIMASEAIAVAEKSGADTMIFVSPVDEIDDAKNSLGLEGKKVLPQEGEDLGIRMLKAFETVFEMGYDRAVLIGTDIPSIDYLMLREALDSLHTSSAVIGPADDGGYYLIGFKKDTLSEKAFLDMTWSHSEVTGNTVARLEEEGYEYFVLPELIDIDDYDDLKRYMEEEGINSEMVEAFKGVMENGDGTKV